MCFAAPCEFTGGGGGGDKKSCGVACSSGGGTPYLTMEGMAVRISDMPIWFDAALGPSFQFKMFYDTTDGRSRSNETWQVGYRWQHDYGCYIDAAGTNRYLQVGGGRSYRFCDNGQGGNSLAHCGFAL